MSQRRPTLATAARVARELNERLTGRYIDKLWRTGRDELLIRFAGEKRRLLVHIAVDLTTTAWIANWPDTPASPDYETIQLRAHLEGGRVASVDLVDERRLVVSLTRGDGPRELSIQLAGRFPNIAAFAGDEQLGCALLQDRDGRDPGAPPLRDGPEQPMTASESWLETHGDLAQAAIHEAILNRARHVVARAARAWRKRTRRATEAVTRDLERAERADEDRVHGELLKTALGRTRKGATEVKAVDYTKPDAPEVTIALDPALDPVENMQRYFRRYRKYRRATDVILERHVALTDRLDAVEVVVAQVAEARTHEDLADAEAALRGTGWRPPRQQRPGKAAEAALPYRRFVAADGTDILVGRGSKHNDALTFRVARGSDIWFHARDSPGAHVILRCPRKATPGQEAVLDAATLAGWHSKSKGEIVIDVTWTERKHVRKPRGAPAGRVTVADGRNIAVRMDQARIDRLYATAPDE